MIYLGPGVKPRDDKCVFLFYIGGLWNAPRDDTRYVMQRNDKGWMRALFRHGWDYYCVVIIPQKTFARDTIHLLQ